jgi:hypothetical protein
VSPQQSNLLPGDGCVKHILHIIQPPQASNGFKHFTRTISGEIWDGFLCSLGFATGCHWYIATCSKFDFYAEIQHTFGLIGESRAFWCRFKNDRDLTSCLILQTSGVVSDRKIADSGSPNLNSHGLPPASDFAVVNARHPEHNQSWYLEDNTTGEVLQLWQPPKGLTSNTLLK